MSSRALITFTRVALAGFKVPKWVDFVDALSRTPSGRIERHCCASSTGPAASAKFDG
jgi:acyl-CoA synthetase (AMP-forming)/AMP-acid ligase II